MESTNHIEGDKSSSKDNYYIMYHKECYTAALSISRQDALLNKGDLKIMMYLFTCLTK